MNFETLGTSRRDASFLKIDAEAAAAAAAESEFGCFKRRVLRFDSFSKVIAAGLRTGWCTGPPELIDRLEMHTQATLLHPSGVSQAVVSALFESWGGAEGFLRHTDEIAAFYKERRDMFLAAAEAELGDRATFDVPKAGMFVWMSLTGVSDSQELIMRAAAERKVLLVPGVSFVPGGAASGMVRASYSTATQEQMREACRRLRGLLDEEAERKENKTQREVKHVCIEGRGGKENGSTCARAKES